MFRKIKYDDNSLSPWNDGNRFLYVQSGISPPLPYRATIMGQNCTIIHNSQRLHCYRCNKPGHKVDNVDKCEAYNPNSNTLPFRSQSNVLSNMHHGDIKYKDICFKSAEHMYQYFKCIQLKATLQKK